VANENQNWGGRIINSQHSPSSWSLEWELAPIILELTENERSTEHWPCWPRRHHRDYFRLLLFNSYSSSLNQAGVQTYSSTSRKCFTLERPCCSSPVWSIFVFYKTFLGIFGNIILPRGKRYLKRMFQILFHADHLGHLIFKYKQSNILMLPSSQAFIIVKSRC
jgi:hypothetical protein